MDTLGNLSTSLSQTNVMSNLRSSSFMTATAISLYTKQKWLRVWSFVCRGAFWRAFCFSWVLRLRAAWEGFGGQGRSIGLETMVQHIYVYKQGLEWRSSRGGQARNFKSKAHLKDFVFQACKGLAQVRQRPWLSIRSIRLQRLMQRRFGDFKPDGTEVSFKVGFLVWLRPPFNRHPSQWCCLGSGASL